MPGKIDSSTSGWGAVIAAGGAGLRLGGPVRKQFLEIAGKSLLRHSLELYLALDEVVQVVAVLPADSVSEFERSLTADEMRRVKVVAGGATRQQSVLNGLEALDPMRVEVVAIHDAARPLADPQVLRASFRLARSEGVGTVACSAMRDTVKRAAGDIITGTVDRADLWLAQTPQTFPLGDILEAHRRARAEGFEGTDDASLFEHLGRAVKVVRSDSTNIKITEPADLEYAGFRLGGKGGNMDFRIGQGYDIHPLAAGRRLVLGGVEIPYEKGLAGHSDADVLVHAVTDALLGALALGDLGKHFPDTDPRFEGIDSLRLLARAKELASGMGYRVVNVDATVVAERPKLAPFIPSMCERIARALGMETKWVSVKATTHERLGALGRGEGIAASAVILVSRG